MSAADKIKRLNRLYAVSSGINEAIVRVPGEQQLYQEACRIAVERGGFIMAWVGRNDPEQRRLAPVARWGKDDGYVDAIRISTDPQGREGRGPGGTAFRTGALAVCNDIEADHQFFAYRAEALARGFRSCAAFPLKQEGRSVAVFLVYAAEPLYFDAEELALLASLADNFSFAIVARERDAQRQQMENALRAGEARLRAVIDNEPECVKSVSVDGVLLDMNPAGLMMIDAPDLGAVLGCRVLDFVHPDDRQAYSELHARVAAGGSGQLQVRAIGLHGRTLWMDTHGVPLRAEDGSVASVLYVTRDVTQQRASLDRLRHQQEEILRLNAELEHRVRQRTAQLELANQELQAFSYSVAHDLRAPLAAIQGFGHALERELAPVAGEKALHYLSRMREGALRTSEMIDALLSLAQLSRAELRWEIVDLSAMALATAQGCREQEPQRQAEIVIQPGLAAYGDPRLLQLVLDNLIGNAWKFTARSPLAQISVLVEQGPEGETVYCVRDNGVGFEPAYAHNLFGAFQRLHPGSEFPGSGIGLANVRRIISRHSGRIWAQARPGEGASFYFTLGDEPA